MPEPNLASQLMAMTEGDLKALGNMLNRESFDERIFGFHAQQATEKALKAWLNLPKLDYPFTHDLSLLLGQIEAQGVEVNIYWSLVDLSAYAVRFRYEAVPEREEELDRENLLSDVKQLLPHVGRLQQEEC